MMIQHRKPLCWVTVTGLAGVLLLAGCSTRSVTVGSSGGETRPVAPVVRPAAPIEEVVKPMEIAKPLPVEKPPVPPQRELLNVYFAFDRWSLSAEGKKSLVQNVDVLKRHPMAPLLIEGYCDERGSREYNLVLGEKRARETRRYLQVLGITNPVSVTSFGKERPVCTEPDESCYWKNRRAHLVIQEGK